MKVYIKCLNVLDGDAIIVNLAKGEKKLVFLIDGGHSRDSSKIISNLNTILVKNNKEAPDFILCTHYDDDHIGGLFAVVKHFGNKIKTVWLHNTSATSLMKTIEKVENANKNQDSIFPDEEDDYLLPGGIKSFSKDPYYEELIKSVTQEINFIELLTTLKITTKEPIAENFIIEDWPELQIIGPSLEYYQKLFPSHFDIGSRMEDIKANATPITTKDAFQTLDSVSRSTVTAPNLNSALLLLSVNNQKILFTGDAGIPSFQAIQNYKTLLNNLFVLKVPHHASYNNLNSELIRLFKPQISLISGNKHVSNLVIDGLYALGSNILSTKEKNDDIEFECEMN